MHVVQPTGYIIAETSLTDDYTDMLQAIGADKWNLDGYHSDGEGLVELAGRLCYKSFGTELNKNLTKVRGDHHEYIGNILKTGHGSVLEHASTTVALIDVSRILTHELVRHRAGCAYSQESMRFVRLEDIGAYIPKCIESDPIGTTLFKNAIIQAEETYRNLVAQYITDDMPFSKKKEITSAIRRIAPSGHSTNIIITANHRAWRHLFELRTAVGVEEEIGVVFSILAEHFRERYPAFYQDMALSRIPDQAWRTVEFKYSKI